MLELITKLTLPFGSIPLFQQAILLIAGLISLFYLFPQVRFIVRAIILANCFFITGLFGVCVSIIFKLTGHKDFVHVIVGKFFSELTQRALGLKFHILDDSVIREYEGKPAIYLGNHQSTLDISYLGTVFPRNTSMMVKESLKYIPFFGQYLMYSNTLMINRKDSKSSIEASNKLAKVMSENNMGVYIYPEGTRSGLEEPGLLPFKKGAFHLAIQTGFPIIPIVYSNTSHLLNTKRWRFERGHMGIKVLKPIPTKGLTKDDIPELIKRVHDVMLKEIVEISKIDYSKL